MSEQAPDPGEITGLTPADFPDLLEGMKPILDKDGRVRGFIGPHGFLDYLGPDSPFARLVEAVHALEAFHITSRLAHPEQAAKGPQPNEPHPHQGY